MVSRRTGSRTKAFRNAGVGILAFVLFDIAAVSIASDPAGSAGVPNAAVPAASGPPPTILGSAEAAALGAPPAPLAPQPIPTAIAIPSIKVRSKLVDLHVNNGELEAPKDYAKAGWWTDGIIPGQAGPAVIVGHVDSTRGAAIFYRVRDLKPGEQISITRADGSVIDFKVEAVKQYSKAEFPTREIYGPTSVPTLRLITCGGKFDRATRHYEDNVIVFATLVPPPAPPAEPVPA